MTDHPPDEGDNSTQGSHNDRIRGLVTTRATCTDHVGSDQSSHSSEMGEEGTVLAEAQTQNPPLHDNDNSLSSLEEGRWGDSDVGETPLQHAHHRLDGGMMRRMSMDSQDTIGESSAIESRRERVNNGVLWTLKVIVLALLAMGAGGLSLSAYLLAKRDQQGDFQQHFADCGAKLIDAFYHRINTKLWIIHNLAMDYSASITSLSSSSSSSSSSWPNFTLPGFTLRADGALVLTKANAISYSPILLDKDTRRQWYTYAEGYAQQNGDVAREPTAHNAMATPSNESRDEIGIRTAPPPPISQEVRLRDGIYLPDATESSLAPVWQISTDGSLNASRSMLLDRDVTQRTIQNMIQVDGTVFGETLLVSQRQDNVAYPATFLYHPIWLSGSRLVGAIGMEFDWTTQLEESTELSERFHGILIVLESFCNGTRGELFSFQFRQDRLLFLGQGDLHDPAFDDTLQQSSIAAFQSLSHKSDGGGMQTRNIRDSWSMTPISNHTCHYIIKIYPSREFLDDYTNANPSIYAFVLVSIFVSTCIVFIVYDCFVERRQSLTVKAAANSRALINSLFPATVRDRMFRQQQQEREQPMLASHRRSTFHRGPLDMNDHQRSNFQDHLQAESPSDSSNHTQSSQGLILRRRRNPQSASTTSTAPRATARRRSTFIPLLVDKPAKQLIKTFLDTGSNACNEETDEDQRSLNSFPGEHQCVLAAVEQTISSSEPIADLFPHTTIMFADIVGFTAWSSEREPHQVFQLLETIYRAFDQLANRLGVFKVETIGDCYVAVAGLPEPNQDHAVVMAVFARECLDQMKELCKKLEVFLGPGTADLALRVGLHSGPVTAGVLRGNKSRFQLFGDTMNTASRMESNSIRNMIHLSQQTADLLSNAGKEHWFTQREESVVVKGKGEMQTFWLRCNQRGSIGSTSAMTDTTSCLTHAYSLESSISSHNRSLLDPEAGRLHQPLGPRSIPNKWGDLSLDVADAGREPATTSLDRLIDWNVDVLMNNLEKVVALRRDAANVEAVDKTRQGSSSVVDLAKEGQIPLEELTEMVVLPDFNKRLTQNRSEPQRLSENVRSLMRDYVAAIASMYHDHPFHNFEHASHVTMSATKLMKRIVRPNKEDTADLSELDIAANIHYSTFGISSDPLTQFAMVFSALIHDVDHPGLPNTILIEQQRPVAAKYQNKCVAEQNSIDVAWGILMLPKFAQLRDAIFATPQEQQRFRQLVVNAVLATDILDNELHYLRKKRWDTAFDAGNNDPERHTQQQQQQQHRKATIVMEHIIQASDVAHTMQHWQIFCKWNERLFLEQYKAYVAEETDRDPAQGWYSEQIGFFDSYVIPLAKKLEDCRVFGVSSDEYLTYAIDNRQEWIRKGNNVVEKMAASAVAKFRPHTKNPAKSFKRPWTKSANKPTTRSKLSAVDSIYDVMTT